MRLLLRRLGGQDQVFFLRATASTCAVRRLRHLSAVKALPNHTHTHTPNTQVRLGLTSATERLNVALASAHDLENARLATDPDHEHLIFPRLKLKTSVVRGMGLCGCGAVRRAGIHVRRVSGEPLLGLTCWSCNGAATASTADGATTVATAATKANGTLCSKIL